MIERRLTACGFVIPSNGQGHAWHRWHGHRRGKALDRPARTRGHILNWNAQIFAYCERGLKTSFWAEPLNAVSNAAFLIAAAAALIAWMRANGGKRGAAELLLILVVAVIGVGSFLFHTFATRWAALADVIPITLFMIAFLAYALRRFAGAAWLVTAALVALFIGTLVAAGSIRCGGGACLNGSVGYLPALAALALVGGGLSWTGHRAGSWLLAGALVFAVSLTFRTLDRALCPMTALFHGRMLGTHFLWHIMNATLLYLLLVAGIRYGTDKRLN